VTQIRRYLPLLFLASCCVPFANAQSSVDIAIGFGSAHDSANSGGIDNANSPNAFGSCTPNTGDSYCDSLPNLGGFFLGFTGDVMLWKHLGIGADIMVQPSRQNYGPLLSRQSFYDFNAIYAPISTKRAVVQLIGGIGAAHTSFGINESGCVGTAVCTSETEPVGTSSHFSIHFGVGVSLFITDHIFIRPEFDGHYVPNFTAQYGSDFAPAGMIWLGYNFGER
jgi:Outer membrane protein beta-barrel domain